MTRPTPIPPDESREDFAALVRRRYNLTPAGRKVLERAIMYQDVSRDRWAAAIIDATPKGEDPIEAVTAALVELLRLRNGYARWEEKWIREAVARERAWLGGPDRDDRQEEVLERVRLQREADEEFERDMERMRP